MIPPVQQRSVEELIDRNLLQHKRSIEQILDRFRNTVIARALVLNEGNITKTAKVLGVHRNTLSRWIDKHGLWGDVPQ